MGAKRCFIGRRDVDIVSNTGQTKSTVVTISIKYATFRFVQPTLDGTERLGHLPGLGSGRNILRIRDPPGHPPGQGPPRMTIAWS